MNHRDTKTQSPATHRAMHSGDAWACCLATGRLCGSKHGKVRHKGFSFFELIVVLVILSTVLGMLAPNLRGFFFAHQTHEKALHLMALMRHARSQAVTQGITHRLTFNLADRQYILQQQVDGQYVSLGDSLGQTFTWPDTVELTFEADVEQNDPIYLIFKPQGTVTPGKITLKGQDEDKGYVLRSLTSSELYALSSIQEDEKKNIN